jgi:vacuolar-type H+-ATPase subunit I/STV1
MDTLHWFQTTSNFNLGELMEKRRFLSVQGYAMADLVGTAHKEFIAAELRRKKHFAHRRNWHMENGAKSIADAIRKVEVEPEFCELNQYEKEAEATFEHGRNLLRSLKGILDAMNQEVAEIRQEKKMYEEESLIEKVVKSVNERNRLLAGAEPIH